MDELENQEYPGTVEYQEEPAAQETPVAEPARPRSPYENSPYIIGGQPAASVEKPVK